MVVSLDVFCPHMKHWIARQLYAAKIVTIKDNLPVCL